MKQIKKIFALVLALMLVLGMATTAYADATTPHTITINNETTGYEYTAYQIFKGTVVGTQLTEIQWGAGVTDGAALLAELNKLDAFKDCKTVVDVATVLANSGEKDNATAQLFADTVAPFLGTVAGTSQPAEGKYVIDVVGDGYYLVKNTKVPAAAGDDPSGSYTRYILKVVENVEVTHKGTVPTVDKEIVGGTTTETGDYNIGDTITYKLTGTLPSNYADYEVYKYVFHDTLSAGLTYTNNLTVKIDGQDVTTSFEAKCENNVLTVSCDDLTEIDGVTISASSKIVVEYTCTLNEKAVVGGEGNPNDVYLEFSNNPNSDSNGETGTTPKDEVVVFTFELDVTKVDGADNTIKLEGAEFKLQNAEGKWAVVDEEKKVTSWADDQDGGSTLTSDKDGFFKIVGLEDGTYNLVETKAPTGYNQLKDPIVIVITSEYDEEGVKTLTIKVDNGEATNGTPSTGVVKTTVENNSGAVLPETGGIGTTIFYAVGGLLVVAAVILLVTKKRMASAE